MDDEAHEISDKAFHGLQDGPRGGDAGDVYTREHSQFSQLFGVLFHFTNVRQSPTNFQGSRQTRLRPLSHKCEEPACACLQSSLACSALASRHRATMTRF